VDVVDVQHDRFTMACLAFVLRFTKPATHRTRTARHFGSGCDVSNRRCSQLSPRHLPLDSWRLLYLGWRPPTLLIHRWCVLRVSQDPWTVFRRWLLPSLVSRRSSF